MKRFIDEFKIKEFTTGYGLTECSPIVTICSPSESISKKTTTVGKTLS